MNRLIILLVLFAPVVVQAQVIFSEIAWMGSVESANHEWIELHNTGASNVDVNGWQIIDQANLAITLTGSIDAGQYVVLERTSDDSAPGVAWSLYTGALVNSGTTLTLQDKNEVVVDSVVGGENWNRVGGDNVTKDTAQLRNGSWVTAPATPGTGASNASPTASSDSEASRSPAQATSRPTAKRIESEAAEPLILPDIELTLSVEGSTTGYVNQPLTFDVSAIGIGPTWINSLSYVWNFGDGYTKTGKQVAHKFAHPGSYVITIYGDYKRHDALGRHKITILPVDVSLAEGVQGELLLHNDTPYELDISGYTVESGGQSFTFPPYSYVLARQSVVVPSLTATGARIADNTGKLIAYVTTDAFVPAQRSFSADITPAATIRDVEARPLVVAEVESSNEQRFGFVQAQSTTSASTSAAIVESLVLDQVILQPEVQLVATTQAATVATNTNQTLRDWWMAALIILLTMSIFAVYSRPNKA